MMHEDLVPKGCLGLWGPIHRVSCPFFSHSNCFFPFAFAFSFSISIFVALFFSGGVHNILTNRPGESTGAEEGGEGKK